MSIERYVPPKLPDVAFSRPTPGRAPEPRKRERSAPAQGSLFGTEPTPSKGKEIAPGTRVRCRDNDLAEQHLVVGQTYVVERENHWGNYSLQGVPMRFFHKRRFDVVGTA